MAPHDGIHPDGKTIRLGINRRTGAIARLESTETGWRIQDRPSSGGTARGDGCVTRSRGRRHDGGRPPLRGSASGRIKMTSPDSLTPASWPGKAGSSASPNRLNL